MAATSRCRPSTGPAGPQSGFDAFVARFDRDDGDFLYRYDGTGPAYRVTAQERDDFIDAYERRSRRFNWTVAIMLVGALAIALALPADRSPVDRWPIWFYPLVGCACGHVVQPASRRLILRAPDGALRDRTPFAPALPPGERRRMALDRIRP